MPFFAFDCFCHLNSLAAVMLADQDLAVNSCNSEQHLCATGPLPSPKPVQDNRIRTGKDTGIGHLPSRHNHINQVWVEVTLIAADLLALALALALAETMLLTDQRDLTKAEPKALRYPLLHLVAHELFQVLPQPERPLTS